MFSLHSDTKKDPTPFNLYQYCNQVFMYWYCVITTMIITYLLIAPGPWNLVSAFFSGTWGIIIPIYQMYYQKSCKEKMKLEEQNQKEQEEFENKAFNDLIRGNFD